MVFKYWFHIIAKITFCTVLIWRRKTQKRITFSHQCCDKNILQIHINWGFLSDATISLHNYAHIVALWWKGKSFLWLCPQLWVGAHTHWVGAKSPKLVSENTMQCYMAYLTILSILFFHYISQSPVIDRSSKGTPHIKHCKNFECCPVSQLIVR